jgi:hypothetical protein
MKSSTRTFALQYKHDFTNGHLTMSIQEQQVKRFQTGGAAQYGFAVGQSQFRSGARYAPGQPNHRRDVKGYKTNKNSSARPWLHQRLAGGGGSMIDHTSAHVTPSQTAG